MNNLWRFLVFICTCFSVHLFAQGNDTSVFFRYAATFDQLLPSSLSPLNVYVPDSSSLEVFGKNTANRTVEKFVSSTYWSESKQKEEQVSWHRYQWDANGRLTNYNSYAPADTVPYEKVRVQYLISQKASDVYYSTPATSTRVDTVSYVYNRMGLPGTWRYRMYSAAGNENQTGMRLYDVRGRVIVATNMMYGNLRGSYTYAYNSDGQLIRRTFNAGNSGVVLCTDTLEYAYQTESRSVMVVTHRLKITGMEKWELLETKTIYPYSNVVVSYTDYNDADENYFYRNLPEYTIRYAYDLEGKLTDEYFGYMIDPDAIHARYYYNAQDQVDSVVYEEHIVEKKADFYRTYSSDVRNYNSTTGLIESRDVTTILFDEKKKKEKLPPREIVHISYVWK